MRPSARSLARDVPPHQGTIWAVTFALVSLACRLGGALPTPSLTESIAPRATPYASQPAAGICAEASGPEVVILLEPGIADPRCVVVEGGQRLRVVNRTGGEVAVSLGPLAFPLPANGETTIGPTFGEYLLPGVHLLTVDPCCGGELWLQTE